MAKVMTKLTGLPGRRSEAQAARTRTRILRSAERLFARKGYRGVSVRDIARACGVQVFTVQNHFGTKLSLYDEILERWDREVKSLVGGILDENASPRALVGRVVDQLFDFYLKRRQHVLLNARAILGEGLSRRAGADGRSWAGFVGSTMRARGLGAPGLDVRLLLMTIEGILNHHALSTVQYRHLFGRDVTDPALAARTKAHLRRVILAILGGAGTTRPGDAAQRSAERARKR